MSEWRELPAGIELDMLIARRSGLPRDATVYDDDGLLVARHINARGEPVLTFVPEASRDSSAALRLVSDAPVFCLFHGDAGESWSASINTTAGNSYEIGHGEANTPALAICRAWLAWKDGTSR